jgi:hypothetical protein
VAGLGGDDARRAHFREHNLLFAAGIMAWFLLLAFILAIGFYSVWLKWVEHKYPRQQTAPAAVAAQSAAPAMERIGFVDAGTLKLGGTGRLELRLDLGEGVILQLSRG